MNTVKCSVFSFFGGSIFAPGQSREIFQHFNSIIKILSLKIHIKVTKIKTKIYGFFGAQRDELNSSFPSSSKIAVFTDE